MLKRLILCLTLTAAALMAPQAPDTLRSAKVMWTDFYSRSSSAQKSTAVPVQASVNDPEVPLQADQAPAPLAETLNAAQEQHKAGAGGNASQARPDRAAENEKLVQAMADVPDSGLQQALEASLQDPRAYAWQFRELLVRRWAEADPKAAAAWSAGLQDPVIAVSATKQAAIAWANKDISVAVQWANALPEGATREAAILALGYEGARTGSVESFDLVASLVPSSERDALLVHIVRQWAAADSAEAAGWAERVPDAALRERLLSAAAISAATKDPYAAASMIATNLPSGHTQDQAAVAIVQRWAQTDPAAAASWTAQFRDSEARTVALLALSSVHGLPLAALPAN